MTSRRWAVASNDGDSGGDDEKHRFEVRRVEDSDDNDRSDVVDDRQGQQEHLDRSRDSRPEEGDDTERKGDVGGHRDPPSVATVAAGVDRHEDHRRHDHPTERGHCRKGDCSTVTQLADDQLALDLHPDDEEEQAHQQVVDQVQQVLVELVVADLDADPGGQERLVAGRPEIGPHQRGDRRADEQDAAGSLDVQEADERLRHDPRQTAIAVQEAG